MSDIHCVVCGEPWDSYGVTHATDMARWEADLFRKGAGCPCCKGESNGYEPSKLSDLDNGDDDPMLRIIAREDHEQGIAPKWERPADPVHWTCDGCGVEVVTDLDTNEVAYHVPYGSKARSWYSSHPFSSSRATPEKEPAHTFGNGVKVCEFCLDHCSDCGAPLASTVEFGDTYDEGHSFLQPGSHTDSVCIDCLEHYCDRCESNPCDCCGDCEQPSWSCDCDEEEEEEVES